MTLRIKTALFCSLLPLFISAQDKMETDRPTEGQSAEVVNKGTLQVETGFRKIQENKDDYILYHPEALLRFGLINRLELRLAINAATTQLFSESKFDDGLQPIEVGIKASLFQTKDSSFITSLYAHMGIAQWASDEHKPDKNFYRLRLLFQNKLTEKIKLSYNIGRDWKNTEQEQVWVYTISPQFELSDKWEVFLEEFAGFEKGHQPEHYIDGGLAYHVTKNLMLDINAGKGISHKSSDYFFTGGVSFRLK